MEDNVHKKTYSDLEQYMAEKIFPVLLPGLENLLNKANEEQCFVKRETKFNPLDNLVEYLYRNNPNAVGRKDTTFANIPFVVEWLRNHPRKPIPKHLIWDEVKAATVIQSFYRSYKVRMQPEVQELRQYQQQLRPLQLGSETAAKKAESDDRFPESWEICLGYKLLYEIADSSSQEGVPMVTPYSDIRQWEKYGEADEEQKAPIPKDPHLW